MCSGYFGNMVPEPRYNGVQYLNSTDISDLDPYVVIMRFVYHICAKTSRFTDYVYSGYFGNMVPEPQKLVYNLNSTDISYSDPYIVIMRFVHHLCKTKSIY